ncbi:2-dehydropantoate 2-reductase [Nitratireductor mangrovi]|uniref:2-dehydropantoate 2-reductase n=1 Tax=Nitratireductor mangrovi TaxID=2599600 RepID=A0A5B8KZL6_9HYPH|nr:2-dehydropantoate 2-reductase [Nitratireductor mangrovi]QDZ01204.1 2-dehydropantoate 2-reductase [Nitratireductor mangrovi]
MFDPKTRITIAGAGSIGCHAGGCLALAGRNVTFLGRERIVSRLTSVGLTIRDLDGSERHAAPESFSATSDAGTALRDTDVVLVAVKSGATAEAAELIARHGRDGAVVVSLQNGVGNKEVLRERLAGRFTVVAGMVPFNVVPDLAGRNPPAFHRATEGTILVGAEAPGLATLLDVAGLPASEARDMDAVLWGKLLVNLNNALNALSGRPLAEELADRRWRVLLADQMAEALAAMNAAGVRPAKIGRLRPSVLPMLLKLPDFLFRRVARQMLAVDPAARSSMWEDLQNCRPTEIDEFQGTVVALAEKHGFSAPANRAVMAAIRQAETEAKGSPNLDPAALRPARR